jgi:hypothetical protein
MQPVSTNKCFNMNRYFSFIIITLIFFSCKKDASDEFLTDLNNPLNDTAWRTNISPDAPVNKIFETLSTLPQTDSFDVQTDHKLQFNDYLQITFPGNACIGEGGEKISGMVKIEIDYLKTKGDMIRFRRSTKSYDRLLESGGAFNIKVMKNGKQLKIAPQKFIIIRYRNAEIYPDMNIFYGDTTAANIDNFTWVPATDMQRVNTWGDSASITAGYEMFSKRFNWINCDKFLDTTKPRTTVSATLPVNFTNNNTAVYLVFKDMLSVVRMYSSLANRLFYSDNIPVNNNITIVSISKIGDDFYLGTKAATVTKNLVVKLSPEKKTKEEINNYINSL